MGAPIHVLIISVVVVIVLLAACGDGDEDNQPQSVTATIVLAQSTPTLIPSIPMASFDGISGRGVLVRYPNTWTFEEKWCDLDSWTRSSGAGCFTPPGETNSTAYVTVTSSSNLTGQTDMLDVVEFAKRRKSEHGATNFREDITTLDGQEVVALTYDQDAGGGFTGTVQNILFVVRNGSGPPYEISIAFGAIGDRYDSYFPEWQQILNSVEIAVPVVPEWPPPG